MSMPGPITASAVALECVMTRRVVLGGCTDPDICGSSARGSLPEERRPALRHIPLPDEHARRGGAASLRAQSSIAW